MEELKRWSVTYTKHVKQKRKVYHDGFLDLTSFNHKIILYDECKNVLDSRFVKKDDVIQSGEAIAFDSYLVDIDHLEGDREPIPSVSYERRDKKIDEKTSAFSTQRYRKGFSSPVNKGEKKTTSDSLSPSQKIIREFMKKEMIKYSSPSLPDTSKSTDEWPVLYTTHVTQKFKKYHDGFIQLVPCGSQGRQIMLYDETRRLLNSRFLKKDEVIRSGESLSFDGHLVDIEECAVESKPLTEKDSNVVAKTGMLENQSHPLIQSTVEFDVMYTIQKKEKYQCGILRLLPCSSYQIKATLLSEEGNVLSNMFLKSSSHNVRRGTTLQMLNYFLEVGELRKGSKGKNHECNSSLKIINLDGKSIASGNLTSKLEAHNDGYSNSGVASQRKYDYGMNKSVPTQTLASAPLRAASEIMSFIKRPATTIKDAVVQGLSSKGSHVKASHSVHSKDKIVQEDFVQDLKCQPDAIHCPSVCVLKETSLSESPGSSDLEAHSHIQGFSEDNTKSDPAVTSTPTSSEKCPDTSNWGPTSPVTELQDISVPKVDFASEVSLEEEQTGQLPGAELCLESTIPLKDDEVENIKECTDHREIKAIRDEAFSEGIPVQISGTPQPPFVTKDVPSEQELAFWQMDDAPSFDLGF
ncbi:hypothetical protein Leryth_023003 [Lithospermum erythrorhizon]|nr:hypothetical protein Leryth_023003 [Lithospermum erythrorhizon]